jgi:hypothetical protein
VIEDGLSAGAAGAVRCDDFEIDRLRSSSKLVSV